METRNMKSFRTPIPFQTLKRCRMARWVGLFLLALAGAGCHLLREEKPIFLNIQGRTYPAESYTSIKRVLVLPFSNESAFQDQADLVHEAFVQKLRECNYFEVVTLPRDDERMMHSLHPYTTGNFPLSVLINIGDCYHVDAVFLGCVKVYNPYVPPRIGLKADMIAVHNGALLRSVNGLLDARDESVSRDIIRYYERHLIDNDSLFEWRIITTSPRLYARYACHRFLGAMELDS
jgi:hypothetical protein